MDNKTLYSIKVFEKMGSPLMNAVLRAGYKDDGKMSKDNAKDIARLINTAVKMSQSLSAHFKPEDMDDGDALRLALACMVSPVVAERFARTDKDFEGKEIDDYKGIFEDILKFADDFTSAKIAANKRLRLADPDPLAVSEKLVFDDTQMILQTMQAMLPVVIRLAEYDFGYEKKDLLAQITEKLQKRAKLLAKSLYGAEMNDSDRKLAELGILRSLTHVYASCHNAEKRRIEDMEEKKREAFLKEGKAPLDELWQMFEMRSGLLVALTKNLLNAPQEPATAKVAPKAEKPHKPEKPAAPKAEKPQTAAGAGSPMSFFTKKPKAEAGNAGFDLPESIEIDLGEDEEDDDSNTGSQGDPSNPMSFFSKKTG